MHRNGELEPLLLVEVFSFLSDIDTVEVEVGKTVFTSRIMASKALYCSKRGSKKMHYNKKFDMKDIL